MIFKTGRDNLACTIFVPFDCKNNCSFCTSKELYSKFNKDIDKIIEDIKTLNNTNFFNEYVLTGGEPISDFEGLKKIIEACGKKVFINTTLPLQENLSEIIDYINKENKIAGINISRHIGFNFKNVADRDIIDLIKKPIRINTVITDKFDFNKFLEFSEYWGGNNRLINLRADYTKITDLTLKNRDEICNKLLAVADNIGNGGCMVCHENIFLYENIMIAYHRGLKNSSFKLNDKLIFVNDILVWPDGSVTYDWDMSTDKEFLSDLGL